MFRIPHEAWKNALLTRRKVREKIEETGGSGWSLLSVFIECLSNCPSKFAFFYITEKFSKAADHGDLEFKILISKIFLNNSSMRKEIIFGQIDD